MIVTALVPRDLVTRLSEDQLDILEASIGNELLANKDLMKRLGGVVKELHQGFEHKG